MTQTSLYTLQPWRANCDLQILLYDSSPTDPNLEEIGKVTDYVVAYACKGNTTLQVEKDTVKNIIME